MMTIFELRDIIKKYGVNCPSYHYVIGGCELLEHIVDVPGFVSLLREFSSFVGFNFVDGYLSDMNHHDPIKFILTGGVTFSYDYLWVFVTVGDEDFYYRGEDDPNEVLRKRKR
jgi:hypothetical protein